jgi:UDP:flavonoid glycosyltransferase YjiC (YdhE family)
VQKKCLLFFPFDLLSHYLRCLELAKQYSDYCIKFAASKSYSPFVKEAGYETFEVEHFDSSFVIQCTNEFNFKWLNQKEIERIFLSQLTAIKKQQPDLVIGDTSPTLKMAAEGAGVKYISLMNSYMSKFYLLCRPVPDIHYSAKYLKKLPPAWSDQITVFAENLSFQFVHKPFRNLRKKYKLKKITSYLSEIEGDENLLCDDPEIFPLKNLPANYKVIGPLMYSPTSIIEFPFHLIDKNKTTICVTLGSTGRWEDLLFLNKTQYTAYNIIVAGDKNKILAGSHILSFDFLNLDTILPHCRILVCHAGNGTLYLGRKHKNKMLFFTSHFEQEWNAKRMEALGLGTRINPDPENMLLTALKAHC